jgi:glycerol-3-phosphate dehydrogenase
MLLQQFPSRTARPPTHRLPLPGGDIADFRAFQLDAQRAEPDVDPRALAALLRNHGAEYWRVLDAANGARAALVPGTTTLCAELWHTVEQEMAVHLEDVVLRRTDLAAGAHPGRAVLLHCAALIGERFAWSSQRMNAEVDATELTLHRRLAREAGGRERAEAKATAAPAAASGQLSAAAPDRHTSARA